ncbi:MAG TPA: isopentenyl-diphosphate Delta-isomerase [Candidatus Tidjanibacter gallistercoris]|nr:isopentenyl-diphosphate Delta-isomerase [Candidatus Tidjanibacter gallistercoris]
MHLNDMVILVDSADRQVDVAPKMYAHRAGLLHRAFSVLVFDSSGRALLQKRAEGKYHSGGLWTNTCCSHPRPGEETAAAAARRLGEEMGMHAGLVYRMSFIYRADLGGGLQEHEYDHVYMAVSDDTPRPNPDEVAEYGYFAPHDVSEGLRLHPERYSAWFAIIWERFVQGGMLREGGAL